MKYLEWNNIIAEHFFNRENVNKDVHLYISKTEIINLAIPFFKESTDDEIWEDFINSLKTGLPGAQGDLTMKAFYCFHKRSTIRIDGIEILFPPYITYLVFFVLPLIEDIDGAFNSNNYFGRFNRFLQKYHISQNIYTSNFRDNNINSLWKDLENWANSI